MVKHRKGKKTINPSFSPTTESDVDVSKSIRQLRTDAGLSIRALAEASHLNVNTLSLIENGKTSPSVSTLQRLASALQIPLTAFFEAKFPERHLFFQKAQQRVGAGFAYGMMEDLGGGLTLRGGQPLIVTLEPQTDIGSPPIVHTGHEFVYCLDGQLTYIVEGQEYLLAEGDSLIFEAHLPHCWGNFSDKPTRSLLVISPADENDRPAEMHFLDLQ